MLYYISHFLLGLVISFVASIPLGPVNVAVAQASLNHSRNVARRIALGSSLVELIYCFLAVAGVQLLGDNKEVIFWITVVSIPVLIGLGIYNLLKKIDEKSTAAIQGPQAGKGAFWLGMSLNVVNPFLLPFWIGAGASLQGNQLISTDFSLICSFAVGVAIGTYLLLMTVAQIAVNQKHLLSPKFLKRVNQGVGIVFIGFAVVEVFVLLFKK